MSTEKTIFDGEKAWQLRDGLEVSRRSLAEELTKSNGKPHSVHSTARLIRLSEEGEITPKVKSGLHYLLWLKDKGYNPCGI